MAEVVTSENLREFQMARINPEAKEAPKEPAKEAPKVESEVVDVEAKVVEDDEAKHDEPKEDKPKRPKLEQRFSELTEARRAAEARAAAAEAKAAELEAKLNPKPVEKVDNEVGPEPKPADYSDAFEYAKDLAKWSTDKALKDRDVAEAKKSQEAEQKKATDAWKKRVETVQKELTDYAEVLASADDLSVSDDVRDALIESEFGPRILYHLASNPEEVAKINDMTVRGALRHIGKLEAQFEKKPDSIPGSQEEAKQQPAVKVARVRPPEPITPVRTNSGSDNKIDAKGEYRGTYQEWKALRNAGKI